MTRKQRDTPFHKSRPSSINNAEGSWCGLAARYRPACEYRFFPSDHRETSAASQPSPSLLYFPFSHYFSPDLRVFLLFLTFHFLHRRVANCSCHGFLCLFDIGVSIRLFSSRSSEARMREKSTRCVRDPLSILVFPGLSFQWRVSVQLGIL